MRIINADKVLDILNELDNHSLDGKMYINNAIHLIEKQPTIYNIDKVIEELEEERQRWIDDINYIETLDDNNENARAKAKAQGYSGAYFNAIEIVKGGGRNEID